MSKIIDVNSIRIGTRKSKLALQQAILIRNILVKNQNSINTGSLPSIIQFSTEGDIYANKSFNEFNNKSIFTKEIENALLNHKIDIAIHCLKDLSIIETEGLETSCFIKRDDPRDALIAHDYTCLSQLPDQATVGTSSLRRSAIIKKLYPHLNIKPLRGNITTRLNKFKNREFDCIILAACGLDRLDLQDYISDRININVMLPAIGQGTICIQHRKDDTKLKEVLNTLNDIDTKICIEAERSFLRTVGGDCYTPIAGYAQIIELDSDIGENDSEVVNGAMVSDGAMGGTNAVAGLGAKGGGATVGFGTKGGADGTVAGVGTTDIGAVVGGATGGGATSDADAMVDDGAMGGTNAVVGLGAKGGARVGFGTKGGADGTVADRTKQRKIHLKTELLNPDGTKSYSTSIIKDISQHIALGKEAGEQTIKNASDLITSKK